MEFCPSCGEEVESLEDGTGWCSECSGTIKTACIACGNPYKRDQPHRRLCRTCREERWLARNADALEAELATGLSITQAKKEVYQINKPVCLSCGSSIPNGRPNSTHFCTQNPECRKWRRRYRTLREGYARKGVQDPRKKALAMISAELFILGKKGQDRNESNFSTATKIRSTTMAGR